MELPYSCKYSYLVFPYINSKFFYITMIQYVTSGWRNVKNKELYLWLISFHVCVLKHFIFKKKNNFIWIMEETWRCQVNNEFHLFHEISRVVKVIAIKKVFSRFGKWRIVIQFTKYRVVSLCNNHSYKVFKIPPFNFRKT